MAGVSTSVKLTDGMSNVIIKITDSINKMLASWESLDASTRNGLDSGALETTRIKIEQANNSLNDMVISQKDFNAEVVNSGTAIDSLSTKIMGMVGAYAGAQGIRKIVGMSDEFVQTRARLNMMNDGLQTTDELMNKIMNAANRSRVEYTSMADIVGKLGMQAGDAFKNNDEIIAFSEALNKMFAVSGLNSTGIESTMYNLTQSLASGALMGQDYRILKQNAPQMIKILEEFYGVSRSELDDMVSAGEVSAESIKIAIINAVSGSNGINAQFASMPMTWGQVWNKILNRLYDASIPILNIINTIANNWEVIEPIVIGITAAILMYAAAVGVCNAVKAISATAEAVHAAALALSTGATFAATAATYGFNAALLACPITWIVIAIIAAIAVVIALANAFSGAGHVAQSAFGAIAGAVLTACAFIANIIIGLINTLITWGVGFLNVFLEIASSLYLIFVDPVAAIQNLFLGLYDFVLTIIDGAAKLLDAILGTDLSSAVESLQDEVQTKINANLEEHGSSFKPLDASNYTLEAFNYSDAYKTGAAWGDGISDKIGNVFDDTFIDGGSISSGIDDIAINTEKSANALDIASEDLKYLRDIAERDTINKFTTAEVRVEMGGVTNNVSNGTDLNGVIDYLVSGVSEALETAAEGVYD